MQPPQTNPMFKTNMPMHQYLALLQSHVRSHDDRVIRQGALPSNAARFIDPLQAWIASMAPSELARRFSISEVLTLAQLTGTYQASPAKREVAQALRALGFRPCRDWTKGGRNRRYWIKCD